MDTWVRDKKMCVVLWVDIFAWVVWVEFLHDAWVFPFQKFSQNKFLEFAKNSKSYSPKHDILIKIEFSLPKGIHDIASFFFSD